MGTAFLARRRRCNGMSCRVAKICNTHIALTSVNVHSRAVRALRIDRGQKERSIQKRVPWSSLQVRRRREWLDTVDYSFRRPRIPQVAHRPFGESLHAAPPAASGNEHIVEMMMPRSPEVSSITRVLRPAAGLRLAPSQPQTSLSRTQPQEGADASTNS